MDYPPPQVFTQHLEGVELIYPLGYLFNTPRGGVELIAPPGYLFNTPVGGTNYAPGVFIQHPEGGGIEIRCSRHAPATYMHTHADVFLCLGMRGVSCTCVHASMYSYLCRCMRKHMYTWTTMAVPEAHTQVRAPTRNTM